MELSSKAAHPQVWCRTLWRRACKCRASHSVSEYKAPCGVKISICQRLLECAAGGRTSGGLVEEEDGGLANERAGDAEPPLLAARQAAHADAARQHAAHLLVARTFKQQHMNAKNASDTVWSKADWAVIAANQ